MAVGFSKTNKPLNPRGNDASPKGYNRAALYSGKALDFDGVNDFISTGTQTAFDMKSIAFHFIGVIDSNTNGFVMHPNDAQYNKGVMIGHFTATLTDECLSIGDGANYTTTKETFDDGIHFVVFSWDATNSKYKIFVNGVELATENNGADSALISGVTSPVFGKRAPLNDFYLDGGLSNARLFDVALTAAQVSDLYNNPEKIVPTGVEDTALKLWLPMMEGAGTTAYDGSGNGNHGTISGATYVNGVGSPVAQSAVIDWNKGVNDIGRSQEFDNAYWGKGGLTLTANATTAPDGTQTADKLVATSNSGSNAEIYRAIGFTANNAASVFVKSDTAQWVTLGTNRTLGRVVFFDIINGVVGTESTGYTGAITEYPNGWYKLDVYWDGTATTQTYWDLSIADADNAFGVTAGKSIFAWGAYANLSDTTIGPYIATLTDSAITTPVLLPQGLTSGRDITGVNLFENVRKQGALNLDGNSWAEVHDNASLDITDAITLEAWVYWDGTANKGFLGRWHNDSSNRNYLLYKASATSFNFYINSTSVVNVGGISSSKGWTHIVGTYDRTNAIVYVDGVGQTPVAHTLAISTGTLPLEIGRNFTTSNQALESPIAQPRIYNRALTAEEVLQNYNSGKSIYQ